MILTAIGALLGLLTALFLFARDQINDREVPVVRDLIAAGAPQRVLAIWAHPDDEVTSAGTLAAMTARGVDLTLVYLTAGEAARDTGYDRTTLAEVRRAEAQRAGQTLGAKRVEVLNWPDGGLVGTDPEGPKADLTRLLAEVQPSTVITFDDRVGFYGHPDHVCTGVWVRDLIEAEPGSVQRLYQATLPVAMIRLALKLVSAFRNAYPTDPERQLPVPSIAVRISRQSGAKRRLLDVHASQAKVMADVQPYYRKLPGWLYYRLFDREYFALAFSRQPEPGHGI
jgi:hypothetical protein